MNSEELNYTDARNLRQKAEEQLNQKQPNPDLGIEEMDMKRLLHELQVHQIELEMQNEELRQANETAEAALKKYTMLYDFAPAGFFTLDADGTIIDLNFTGAEMLGDRRFSLLNSNFRLYVSETSKETFNTFLRKVIGGIGKESCEVLLGYDNRHLCTVYMDGIATREDKKCLLSVIDISPFTKLSIP